MTDTLIYIENQLIDLSDNTILAATFQNADLGELNTRKINYTNRIKVPKTETNNKIFENSDLIYSESDIPYRQLSARIIQNGIPITNDAFAYVTSADSHYNIDFVFTSFFDRIKNKKITELNFGEALVTWNAAKIDSCRKDNTSVLLAPMVFYGQNNNAGATYVMGNTQPPSVKYKSVIQTIITNAGYAYDGNIFSDAKYSALLIPFSRDKFDFGGTFTTNREFEARKTTTQTVTNPGAGYAVITFDELLSKNAYGFYDTSISRYVTAGADDRNFRSSFYYEVTFTILSGSYYFRFVNQAGTLLSPDTKKYSTPGTYSLVFKAAKWTDDTEGWKVTFTNWFEARVIVDVAGQIDITAGRFYNHVLGENFLATNPKFYPNEILPDITQTDIIKDFCIRFGVVINERDKTLTCRQWKDIVKDKVTYLDLTAKRDESKGEAISFKSNLAKINNFTYTSSDVLFTSVNKVESDGTILLDNTILPATKEIYESIFEGTYTTFTLNGSSQLITLAWVALWSSLPTDYLTAFANSPGNRLILTRTKYASEPAVTYNGSARSDYLIGYFLDPLADYDMSWRSFLLENYSDLTPSLVNLKTVTRYYNLDEVDIAKMDFQHLIYDENIYYILNKVENFKPGQVTKVELIKK